MAHTSIRFGVGRFSTQEEVDYAYPLPLPTLMPVLLPLPSPVLLPLPVPVLLPLPLPQPLPLPLPLPLKVDYAIDACAHHVDRLREMSPLWEMVQEGIDIKKIEWVAH